LIGYLRHDGQDEYEYPYYRIRLSCRTYIFILYDIFCGYERERREERNVELYIARCNDLWIDI
jgi:hypothetical protein